MVWCSFSTYTLYVLGNVACLKACVHVHEEKTSITRALIYCPSMKTIMQHKCTRNLYWSGEFGLAENDKHELKDYVIESRFSGNYNDVHTVPLDV